MRFRHNRLPRAGLHRARLHSSRLHGARFHRAVASAALSSLATACAHELGGGAFPHPVLLGLAFALSIPLCWALGGRRATALSLGTAVTAAELAQHVAYSLQSAHTIAQHGHQMLFMHLLAGGGTFALLRATDLTLRRIVTALIIASGVALARTWHVVRRTTAALTLALRRTGEVGRSGRAAASYLTAHGSLRAGSPAVRRAATGTTPLELRQLVLAAPVIRRGPPVFS